MSEEFRLNVDNLRGLLENICAIKDLKLVARPVPNLELGRETLETMLERVAAARRVIVALMQSTKVAVSSAETLELDELTNRITGYFDQCDKEKVSYTVPGLSYAIGFVTRQDFLAYVKENRDTKHDALVMARSLLLIEDQRNREIISKGGVMAGHKLDLATNFDWTDARSGKKEDDKTPQQQLNVAVNVASLPPEMSLAEWQAAFLKPKEVAKLDKEEIIDVEPQAVLEAPKKEKKKPGPKPKPKVEVQPKERKKPGPKPKPVQSDRIQEARKARYFRKKTEREAAKQETP